LKEGEGCSQATDVSFGNNSIIGSKKYYLSKKLDLREKLKVTKVPKYTLKKYLVWYMGGEGGELKFISASQDVKFKKLQSN